MFKKEESEVLYCARLIKQGEKLNLVIKLDLILCFVRSRIKLTSCDITFRTSQGSQGLHLKEHFRNVK